MTVYLIRHSITNLNCATVGYPTMCGSTQAHVTDKGIELAKRAAFDEIDFGDYETVPKMICQKRY